MKINSSLFVLTLHFYLRLIFINNNINKNPHIQIKTHSSVFIYPQFLHFYIGMLFTRTVEQVNTLSTGTYSESDPDLMFFPSFKPASFTRSTHRYTHFEHMSMWFPLSYDKGLW